MKTALYWAIGIVVVVGAAGLYWFMQSLNTPPAIDQTTKKTEKYFYPDNNSTSVPVENTYSLGTQLGGTILTKDFLKDSSTVESKSNKGYYYLGYHYDDTAEPTSQNFPYIIQYIESTQVFTIAILQKPYQENRDKAEQYLISKLGVPRTQLCQLRYSVGIPNDVDTEYSGIDLRFSSCPSATKLP